MASKWELTREVQKHMDKVTRRWHEKVVWVVVSPEGQRWQFTTRQKAKLFLDARKIAP